jgi:hypothetical protein
VTRVRALWCWRPQEDPDKSKSRRRRSSSGALSHELKTLFWDIDD